MFTGRRGSMRGCSRSSRRMSTGTSSRSAAASATSRDSSSSRQGRVVLSDMEAHYLDALAADFAGDRRVTVAPYDLDGEPSPVIASRRFDTIVAVNVVEHIRDDAGAGAAADRAAQARREVGRLRPRLSVRLRVPRSRPRPLPPLHAGEPGGAAGRRGASDTATRVHELLRPASAGRSTGGCCAGSDSRTGNWLCSNG